MNSYTINDSLRRLCISKSILNNKEERNEYFDLCHLNLYDIVLAYKENDKDIA